MWSGRFCPRRATRSASWRPSRWHRSRSSRTGRALEVPGPDPEVPADVVDAELERIRDSVAELVPVTGRSSQQGDTVVLDLVAEEPGAEPSEHRDYVVELGTGYLADELEAEIPGMVEGDTREVTLDLGEDNPSGKVDRHVEGDQGEGAARARRRARAVGQRVRDAGGASQRHREPADRAARERARRPLPAGRPRRARRRVDHRRSGAARRTACGGAPERPRPLAPAARRQPRDLPDDDRPDAGGPPGERASRGRAGR